ncbi:MAG: hypothetical protein M3N53_00910 [Actinomycetota bacterium]|nr:hypothetical protein [Actinomycetota bacterium]
MKMLASLCCAVLLLAGCDSDAATYDDAAAVVDAMAEAEIVCEGLETTTEFSDAEHESLVTERGLCTVDGEPLVITMFANAEDRDDWVAVGRLLGSVAIGPNWVASSRSEETIARIAEALDATRPAQDES